MTRTRTAWGGKTYIYYFWSFHDAKPVPPLAQNPGDATGISAILYSVVRDYLYIICS